MKVYGVRAVIYVLLPLLVALVAAIFVVTQLQESFVLESFLFLVTAYVVTGFLNRVVWCYHTWFVA